MQPYKSSLKVEEDLKLRILNHEFSYNQKLPSERVLADYYSMQRATIREALKNLENEGLIYIVQRQGAFLAEPKVIRKNTRIETVAQSLDLANFNVSIEVNKFESTYLDRKLAKKMKLEIGIPTYTCQRFIYSKNNPIAIETFTVLKDKFEGLNLNNCLSLDTFDMMKIKYNINASTSDKILKVVYSNESEMNFFGLNEAKHLLKEEGMVFDTKNEPLAFIEYILLPGRFMYTN